VASCRDQPSEPAWPGCPLPHGICDETIAGFLDQLAARVPAPCGGATAALHAAEAAALLGMVARYGDGPRYDADAFGAVASAYRLPKDTVEEQAAQSAAIASATAKAARPSACVLAAAMRLIGLAKELLPAANRSVISDVAAAAETDQQHEQEHAAPSGPQRRHGASRRHGSSPATIPNGGDRVARGT
jgi:formiminotetrahydrofolate cyclodeaminase